MWDCWANGTIIALLQAIRIINIPFCQLIYSSRWSGCLAYFLGFKKGLYGADGETRLYGQNKDGLERFDYPAQPTTRRNQHPHKQAGFAKVIRDQ